MHVFSYMVSVVLGVALPLVCIVLVIVSMIFRMDARKQYDNGERSTYFSWLSLISMMGAMLCLLFALDVYGVSVVEKMPLWLILAGAVFTAVVLELAYKLFVSTFKWSDELPRLYE